MIEISDFWEQFDDRAIHLKEAEAVFRVLLAMVGRLMNSQVRVLTDNISGKGISTREKYVLLRDQAWFKLQIFYR